MLIVEGSDCTGKTTLCRRLVEVLNNACLPHTYAHLSRLPDSFHRYWGYVDRAAIVVQDRFHMSEVAYCIGRGEDPERTLDPETYRLVDARLRKIGSYTVVLSATHEQLCERYEATREMYDLKLVVGVNQTYKDLIAGRIGNYRVDCDLHICDRFPNEADVKLIVQRYIERFQRVQEIASVQYLSNLL